MKKYYFSLIFFVLCLFLLPLVAEADIKIAESFPDEYFSKYISNNFDVDGDGFLSDQDIDVITDINCSGMHIKSLKGIELLPNLTSLNCSSNKLTELNVSNNVQLAYLYCADNEISQLDVSKNTCLYYLSISNNNITSIDLSHNTQLDDFTCESNKIKSIDLKNNTKMTWLNVSDNELTALDISVLPQLSYLVCRSNNIEKLDFSNCPLIETCICSSNKIKSLNLSNLRFLRSFACNSNQLSSIFLPKSSSLRDLSVANNQLSSIDVNGCTELTELLCNNNKLETLNLDNLRWIIYLNCSNNKIKALDVSLMEDLETMDCTSNMITQMSLANSKLSLLLCQNNNLEYLDISKCSKLAGYVLQSEPEIGGFGSNVFTWNGLSVDHGVTIKASETKTVVCHDLREHGRVEPTNTTAGTEAYWECAICGKLFSDNEGENEIIEPVAIPMLEGSDDSSEPVNPDPGPAFESENVQVTLKKLKSVKLKAESKKKIKISWKKLSSKDRKKIKKIQIQISTDPNFETILKTKLVSSKKTSYTVSGLKKNTKYYIRIRAYTEKDGIKYVSEWIKKSKKTKKK